MSTLQPTYKYFQKYARLFVPGVLFCFISAIFTLIVPSIVREAIDTIPQLIKKYNELVKPLEKDIFFWDASWTMLKFALYALAISFGAGFFLFLMRQTIIVASRHIEYDLRNEIYEHVQKLPAAFFQKYKTGDVITRATSDLEQVRLFVGPAIMYASRSIVLLITALFTMFWISPILTLWALTPMPLLFLAIFFMSKLVHTRSAAIQTQYSALTAKVQEVMNGIRVVKAYTREAFEAEAFDHESKIYQQKNLDLAKVEAAFSPIFISLIGFSTILVLWIGGGLVMQKQVTFGNIAEFIIYVTILTWPVASLGIVINMIQRAKAAMKRISELLEAPVAVQDTALTNPKITQIEGAIQFEEVSYNYPNATLPAIENLSFNLSAGKTLAFVGKTGCGKSTAVELITRLTEATTGKVKIDGHNIQTIPLNTLRSAISYVPQEVFLFSETIAGNIAFGKIEAQQQEVERAAQEADLFQNIAQFPDKFETMVGERGITLSGGQKQRAAIARALIRNPKILILDDALSAVDAKTEHTILKNLRKNFGKQTIVLVSHRVSTVQDADLILYFEKGKVTERGTHQELVALGGKYAELNRKQLLEAEIAAF